MRKMLISLCLPFLFWGQACLAATQDLYSTAPGQHNQNSTIINGDVYIDNRNGMTPGFAGTWRDPESGDIITSVIAPRQQMIPPAQGNVYAPYMSGNGYYENEQPDRHPQGHRPGHGPGQNPNHGPDRYPGAHPGHYPGQHMPPAMPPQMRPQGPMPPAGMQPGMPPATQPGMRPVMPGGFPGGGR